MFCSVQLENSNFKSCMKWQLQLRNLSNEYEAFDVHLEWQQIVNTRSKFQRRYGE